MSELITRQHVSDSTIKRLAKEIGNLYKNPLDEEGIYYIHDDTNMLKGYALIIGPDDTPYQYGNYLFEFYYPDNYPNSPPKVKFCTQDSSTRFHPNLYRTGKVCLSILNTWYGDSWTSCQTIRSVLLTLVSIMTTKALLNEPGIKEHNVNVETYDEFIRYKNYKVAIYDMLLGKGLNNKFRELFYDTIKQNYDKNKDKISQELLKMKDSTYENSRLEITFYKMSCVVSYNDLIEKYSLL